MRTLLALSLTTLALAGCTAQETGCPPGLPQAYADSFAQMEQELRDNGLEAPDQDGDCVPDAVEVALETDPADRQDFPDFTNATVVQRYENGTAPIVYAWQAQQFTGDYTAIALFDLDGFLSPRMFDVPDGALTTWFNLTLSGMVPTEASLRFISPDDDADTVEGRTSGGTFSVEVEEPAGGEWRLVMWATAVDQGSWTLDVNSHAPAPMAAEPVQA